MKQFIVPPSKLRSKSRTASRTSTSYLVARRSFAAHLDVLFVEDVFPGFGLFVAPSHNPSSPNVALASPCRRSRGAPRVCRYHGNSSAWNASPISIEDTREETLDVRRITRDTRSGYSSLALSPTTLAPRACVPPNRRSISNPVGRTLSRPFVARWDCVGSGRGDASFHVGVRFRVNLFVFLARSHIRPTSFARVASQHISQTTCRTIDSTIGTTTRASNNGAISGAISGTSGGTFGGTIRGTIRRTIGGTISGSINRTIGGTFFLPSPAHPTCSTFG